jgi:hypothetical protein
MRAMGSLDDAIREHLELKRRLGASDDEIKEKETEAFGKGNRPVPPGSEPEPALAPDVHEEPFIDPNLAAAEPAANGQHSTAEWDESELSASQGTSTADEIFEPDEVPADEALTVRDERRRREEKRGREELAEEPAEEDVLEETPEFLEETPEHDRLWFEQRPPKDFDFD